MSVAPQALLVTDRAPSGAVTVLNPNDVPLDVRVGLRYGYVTTDSATRLPTVRFIDDSVAPANSAVPLLRFSPARFRLAPGASQLVRIVALTRTDVPSGEFWARLTVTSRRDERPLGTVAPGARINGELTMQVETVIPVFLRKGPVVTSLTARLDSMRRVGQGLAIDASFIRGGTGAAIGALLLEALDARGAVLGTLSRQLAVYDTLRPRFLLPLGTDALRRAMSVRLSITSRRPDLPDGLVVPFTPVQMTVPIAKPPGGPPDTRSTSRRGGPAPSDDDGTDPVHWGPAGRRDTVPPRSPLAASPDYGILAVVVGGIEMGTIFTLEGDALESPRIPVRSLGQLLGIAVDTSKVPELRIGGSSADQISVLVDGRTGRVTRRRPGRAPEQLELGRGAIRIEGDDWYVPLAQLPALMGLSARVDVSSASLIIETPRAQLPRFAVGRRAARTVAHEASPEVLRWTPGNTLHRGGWIPSTLALTYNVAADNTTGEHSATATVGTAIFGGGLSTLVTSYRFGDSRRIGTATSWLGGSPNSAWFKQVRLGSGVSTGPFGQAGRGISLTNAPFLRDATLGRVMQRGHAPPGAEVEISRNGQVVGVAIADSAGQWALAVPVTFGENALELAIYTGDKVRRSSTMLGLESDLIPSGRIEYGLTAQRNDLDGSDCRLGLAPCGWVSNADLRIGLGPRITARGGLYRLDALDGVASDRPYASLIGSPFSWLQLRGEAADRGWWRARAVLQPSLRLRLEATQEAIDSASAPFFLGLRARTVRGERAAQFVLRPFAGDLGRFWLAATWRQSTGLRTELRGLTATIGLRSGGLLWQAVSEQQQVRDINGASIPIRQSTLSVTVPQWRRGPRLLQRMFTTLSSTAGDRAWQSVAARSSVALGSTLQLHVTSEWSRIGGNVLRVQFQHQGPIATLVQAVDRSARGELHATSTIMGAASIRPGSDGVRLSNDFVALRSAVTGIAFEDINGNGRADANEPRLANLAVRVGRETFRTDAAGIFVATGLPVLDATPVSAELPSTYSTDGRALVPAAPLQWAMLVPFGETRVLLPFVAAASGVGHAPAGAWEAVLIPLARANGRALPVEVFDDGVMPLGPVPAGRYRLQLRERGEVGGRILSCVVQLDPTQGRRVRVSETGSPDAMCEPMP